MLIKKKAEGRFVSAGLSLIAGNHCAAEAKARIGNQAELEQLPVDWAACCSNEPGSLAMVERELDDSARNVPGEILATHQIVTLVMIERIRFEQPPARQSQPFVPIELVIRANAPHARLEQFHLEAIDNSATIVTE
jgi:hypothetical protein